MPSPLSERKLVFLIGAVQFINTLDFMMVMPMGPDFAKALGIPSSDLGLVGGSYTAAAAIAGVDRRVLPRSVRPAARARRGDRRARRSARPRAGSRPGCPACSRRASIAGAFGGPATSIALAIVSDAVPAERRGRAMGAVMGAFSVASVLGVPAGLELARLGGWRMPFFTVAALGAVVAAGAVTLLPPQTGHLVDGRRAAPTPFRERCCGRPVVLLSLSATAVAA